MGAGGQAARLGPDAGALVQRRERQIAHAQRDQIGRDRIGHAEAPGLPPVRRRLSALGQHFGAHHHREVGGRGDAGVIGLANAGAVLRRHPGAGQDRLALAEQIGLLTARRLLRAEPLKGGRVRAGRIVDDDAARLSRRQGREADGQRLAKDRIVGARLELQRLAGGVGHRADVHVADVQNDLVGARHALDVQRRRARQGLGGEVGLKVQRDVAHARDFGPRVGVDVAGVVDWRISRCGQGRHVGASGRGAGRDAERGGESESRDQAGASADHRRGHPAVSSTDNAPDDRKDQALAGVAACWARNSLPRSANRTQVSATRPKPVKPRVIGATVPLNC